MFYMRALCPAADLHSLRYDAAAFGMRSPIELWNTRGKKTKQNPNQNKIGEKIQLFINMYLKRWFFHSFIQLQLLFVCARDSVISLYAKT